MERELTPGCAPELVGLLLKRIVGSNPWFLDDSRKCSLQSIGPSYPFISISRPFQFGDIHMTDTCLREIPCIPLHASDLFSSMRKSFFEKIGPRLRSSTRYGNLPFQPSCEPPKPSDNQKTKLETSLFLLILFPCTSSRTSLLSFFSRETRPWGPGAVGPCRPCRSGRACEVRFQHREG